MPDKITRSRGTHTWYTAKHEKNQRRHTVGLTLLGGSVNGYRDRFTIANTATTDYALTFVPRVDTLNLFLNGLALDEGVDYSVDYSGPKVVLTSAATRAVGDILWGRYLTADATPELSTILTWGIRSDTATIVAAFDAVALIDSGVAFSDVSADLDPGSGEMDLVFGARPLPLDDSDSEYLFLRTGVGPGLFHFTRVSGVDTDTLISSISSLTGAHTYGVTASGTTLTVKKDGVTQATVVLTGSDAAALANTLVGLRGTDSTGIAATNFTAAGGTVTDAFSRTDADQLGRADTGQIWMGGL